MDGARRASQKSRLQESWKSAGWEHNLREKEAPYTVSLKTLSRFGLSVGVEWCEQWWYGVCGSCSGIGAELGTVRERTARIGSLIGKEPVNKLLQGYPLAKIIS